MIYVLHVRTGHETDVKWALGELGHTAILPAEERIERRGGQWRSVIKTLMPGYIFVMLSLTDQAYYAIRAIPHVLRFLGGGSPVPLPPDEEAFVMFLHNGGKPLQPSIITGAGISGPLAHESIKIIKLQKRQRRARAVVNILGEPREITLSILTGF